MVPARSTLLKILSRINEPTPKEHKDKCGSVGPRGKVLMEVGTVFFFTPSSPAGREHRFLPNGAILGDDAGGK